MTMLQQIFQLILDKPKHYSRIIKASSEMSEWVKVHSLIRSEKYAAEIFSAITQSSNICPHNKIMKFKGIKDGWGFCGRTGICQCAKESVSIKVIASKAAVSAEEQAETNARRAKTNLEKYGVENIGQTEQAKQGHKDFYANENKVKICVKKHEQTCLNRFGVKNAMSLAETQEKVKVSKKEKYGDRNFNNRDQAAITSKAKYGTDNPAKSELIKDRIKITNNARYGADWYIGTEDFTKKSEITMKERYGVSYSMQSDTFSKKSVATRQKKYGNGWGDPEKRKVTCQTKYNVDFSTQKHFSPEILDILTDKEKFSALITGNSRLYAANKLGISDITINRYAIKHDVVNLFNNKKSRWETEISEFITNFGVTVMCNDRTILSPLELDFYFPDFNAAIEINGNYWHSEIAGGKDKKYHYNKWLACREQGIDLYSYFEDELIDNLDIIKSKIKYITKQPMIVIGARKCTLSYIDSPQEKIFLNQYHIQGRQGSRNKTLGAFYNNELIAIFSWLNRKQYLEVTRYACDTKASYPGLFSKMMKHMIRDLDYSGPIVSFSNNGHSNGGVYKASGFHIEKIMSGAYWYTKDYRYRENRQSYMKADIAKKFGIDMSSRTEWQAMQELGYDRIWDSGKIKWILEV